jgi:hypothetical protein
MAQRVVLTDKPNEREGQEAVTPASQVPIMEERGIHLAHICVDTVLIFLVCAFLAVCSHLEHLCLHTRLSSVGTTSGQLNI